MGRDKWKDGRRVGFTLISATGCSRVWCETRYGCFFLICALKGRKSWKGEFEVSEL